MAEPHPIAVGRLPSGGAWIGFAAGKDGYRLACSAPGEPRPRVSMSSGAIRTDELLVAAIAYFEELLDPPPPQLEATQADVAALLRWLAAEERDPECRRILSDAVDAVDDGLGGDAVTGLLRRARERSSPRQRLVAPRSDTPGRSAPLEDGQRELLALLAARCGPGSRGSAPRGAAFNG